MGRVGAGLFVYLGREYVDELYIDLLQSVVFILDLYKNGYVIVYRD